MRHSHFGIAVRDIESSARFYTGAFGFERAEQYRIDDGLDAIMELEAAAVDILFLRRNDVTLELLRFRHPAPFGERDRRPMNRYGFTHISFWVDDLEVAMAKVLACGGAVHERTRTVVNATDLLYCTDPDGVRVELMQPLVNRSPTS
jgi:catechol 2,3-dioxygenase-like lactoylglutathione lyase family enzyme